jgi:hypothetical protein
MIRALIRRLRGTPTSVPTVVERHVKRKFVPVVAPAVCNVLGPIRTPKVRPTAVEPDSRKR